MDEHLEKHDREIEEVRDMLFGHLAGMEARTEALKAHLEDVVRGTIKTTVNGKLDAVHGMLERQNEKSDTFEKKVDAHMIVHEQQMSEIRPFLQGVAGFKVLQKLAVWMGGFGIAYLAVRNSIKF